jgi:hypothetical protein
MKHLTIRGISPDLAKALEKEARDRSQSLNQAVKDLLARALGRTEGGSYDNGLGRFAGSWSEEDMRLFEERTASFEQIDDELWR